MHVYIYSWIFARAIIKKLRIRAVPGAILSDKQYQIATPIEVNFITELYHGRHSFWTNGHVQYIIVGTLRFKQKNISDVK